MKVFLIAAMTIDGFIAQNSTQISTSWTSPEDKKWFNQRTKEARVIVMGSKTYDTIGRGLPGRLTVVMTSQPERYPSSDESVRFTNQSQKAILELLEKENYSEVAICGGSSVYTQFMKAGLIDTLYLTLEPIVFGQGVGLFNEEIEAKLQLIEVKNLSDQTLLLEYEVKRS
jgi:dihydrofolate reductase